MFLIKKGIERNIYALYKKNEVKVLSFMKIFDNLQFATG